MDLPAWAQIISEAVWSAPLPPCEKEDHSWEIEIEWPFSLGFPMKPFPQGYQKLKSH